MRAGRAGPAAGAALALVIAVAGCGGGDGRPVVLAAASLVKAFEAYGETDAGGDAHFSFAGSDELAEQIRRGARADVFASADTTLPEALFRERLARRPRVFATNRLVVAVPRDGGRVAGLEDLGGRGVNLVIGDSGVPIGAYTRALLGRLAPKQRRAVLANVRSREPSVAGIAGKLAQGAADAGFLYATDVKASNGRLRAIAIPPRLRPDVRYAVAVLRHARHPAAARRFVAGLRGSAGRGALRDAGFGAGS